VYERPKVKRVAAPIVYVGKIVDKSVEPVVAARGPDNKAPIILK
jgi:hypothetical protein